jgi:hypothetical protein
MSGNGSTFFPDILSNFRTVWFISGHLATLFIHVITYAAETWPIKVEDMHRLETADWMMVRHMCRVSLKDRKSSDKLRCKLGLENISNVIWQRRLRWFGHVEREEDSDRVKACQKIEINGERDRGRGRKTWSECVKRYVGPTYLSTCLLRLRGCSWELRMHKIIEYGGGPYIVII